MALPYTDNFTDADNTTLATDAAGGWADTVTGSTCKVLSNQCVAQSLVNSLACASYVGSPALNADQYAQALYVSGNYPGVFVRGQTNAQSFYYFVFQSGDLYAVSAGTLGSSKLNVGAGTGGTVYGVEAHGTTIRLYSGAYPGTTLGSVTDATYATGTAGIALFNPGGTLDNFECGNFSGGSGSRGLFRTPPLSGVGIGGSFFSDPLQMRAVLIG